MTADVPSIRIGGKIKSYNNLNGYGFITCSAIKEDIYFSYKDLPDNYATNHGAHLVGKEVDFNLILSTGQHKPQGREVVVKASQSASSKGPDTEQGAGVQRDRGQDFRTPPRRGMYSDREWDQHDRREPSSPRDRSGNGRRNQRGTSRSPLLIRNRDVDDWDRGGDRADRFSDNHRRKRIDRDDSRGGPRSPRLRSSGRGNR